MGVKYQNIKATYTCDYQGPGGCTNLVAIKGERCSKHRHGQDSTKGCNDKLNQSTRITKRKK